MVLCFFEWVSRERPLKRLCHRLVEILDKGGYPLSFVSSDEKCLSNSARNTGNNGTKSDATHFFDVYIKAIPCDRDDGLFGRQEFSLFAYTTQSLQRAAYGVLFGVLFFLTFDTSSLHAPQCRNINPITGKSLTGNSVCDDVDSLSAAVELNFAVHNGEDCEIITDTSTATGMELGADLTNKNVPRPNELAAEPFDSPPLTVGIPTIPAGPLTLFMCHCSI